MSSCNVLRSQIPAKIRLVNTRVQCNDENIKCYINKSIHGVLGQKQFLTFYQQNVLPPKLSVLLLIALVATSCSCG